MGTGTSTGGNAEPDAENGLQAEPLSPVASAELPPSTSAAPVGVSSPGPDAHRVTDVAMELDEADLLEEESDGSSSVSSVFTLCNSAIGAGVLSLPYAFRCAGAHA